MLRVYYLACAVLFLLGAVNIALVFGLQVVVLSDIFAWCRLINVSSPLLNDFGFFFVFPFFSFPLF